MITVVGSINLDLIATVERLPGRGETVAGDSFTTSPGGKGANQALAARRAGAPVVMVGAVGKDPFAEGALACLREALIDLSPVREAHAATGTALIMVETGGGDNVIAVVPGANASLKPGDLRNAEFREGTTLLVQNEIPTNVIRAALEAAKTAGVRSIYNVAPYRAETADLVPLADYLVANETEFDLYADALGLAAGERRSRMSDYARRTGSTVIVTLGAEGAMAAMPEGVFHVPSPRIEAVDTVGAGDTFCGYLAAGLQAGLGLEDAMRRAAAAGALACLKQGAQPSIPHARDVEAFIRSDG
jgi:ribokinase